MKFVLIIVSCAVFIFAIGCGEKAQEIKNLANMTSNLEEKAEKIKKDMSEAEERVKERKAKGDTLAMHYKDLQKYLPESINGYTAEKAKGESTQMGMFSLSQASRRYVMDTPEGQKFVKIEIMDYNQSQEMFMGFTAMFAGGMKIENDQKIEQTFDPGFKHVTAYETYNKIRKDAELTYAVGWRFIISAKANKQEGTDFLKDVLKSI